MQLAAQSYGSSGGPLLVLHGLFGSRESWHSICLQLSRDFRVWALDQRNHGASPHSGQMDYPTMAEDVREFILGHSLQSANVLGHSMGAKTAMALALLYPQLVRSLISVDMAPRAYEARHEKIVQGLLALQLESAPDRQHLEHTLETWVPDLATRRFLLKNARRSSRGFHWRIGLHEIARNYPRLSEAVEGRPYPGPALFVRGEQSDYLTEQDLPSIRTLFPQAELTTIAASSHLVQVDQPDLLIRRLREFLKHADA